MYSHRTTSLFAERRSPKEMTNFRPNKPKCQVKIMNKIFVKIYSTTKTLQQNMQNWINRTIPYKSSLTSHSFGKSL